MTALSACASDDASDPLTSPTSATTTPPVTSQAPSVDPTEEAAVALRGDWEITSEDYVLHLIEDGTFIEDFEGVKDFRVGKYSVDGDTISLVGDDGNTDEGKIVDDTLVFTLGTATRIQ
ncbi:Atu4866 domain-containing protein [Aeromicrobium sp. UC242_57]|uniref:Atu4866 domain-containing protein n=1 Tax=Aeromicrobium sp. UC242_57 TaxID=3374624 RepID=UPI0037912EC1